MNADVVKQQGELLGIAFREKSRGPMRQLESAEISLERGVVGDSRGKPGARQVTLLAEEAWQAACREIGKDIDWTVRRANLLLRGLQLFETIGASVSIGDVLLEVTAETDPCDRMDQQVPGLQRALTPEYRGGVCCRVIRGGSVRVGDAVQLLTLPSTMSGSD